MRPLFYEYPEDEFCWEIEDQYLYGSDILVAPILEAGLRSRILYLPWGSWVEYESGKVYGGGKWIELETTIQSMPVFVKQGKYIL